MKPTILITGASGNVGSWVVKSLLNKYENEYPFIKYNIRINFNIIFQECTCGSSSS